MAAPMESGGLIIRLDDLTLALVGVFAGPVATLVLGACSARLRAQVALRSRAWSAMRFTPPSSALSANTMTIAGAKMLHTRFTFLRDQIRANKNSALRKACKNGNLPLAKWLVETFGLTVADVVDDNNGALHNACHAGHLNVVIWLVDEFELRRSDLFMHKGIALFTICARGDMKLVIWLVERFDLTGADFERPHVIPPSSADPVRQNKINRLLPRVRKIIARVSELYGTGHPAPKSRARSSIPTNYDSE